MLHAIYPIAGVLTGLVVGRLLTHNHPWWALTVLVAVVAVFTATLLYQWKKTGSTTTRT